MSFSFENPIFLAGLLVIPLIILYSRHYSRRKSVQAFEFSRLSAVRMAAADSRPVRIHTIVFSLGLLAVALIFIGLSNPMIPLDETKDGINLVLALDVSGSMKATDYVPDRITAAKSASESLIRQLDPKDYAGIITFDSRTATPAYLSPDRGRVIEKLDLIEAGEDSTAIGDGLALAVDMAVSLPGRKGIVVLLSDGESNSGYISPASATEFAKEKDVLVYTVALGSDEPVLVSYDWANNPGYATVNEDVLREIAENTGGEFFRSVDEKTLEEIYSGLDEEILRETKDTPVGWIFILASGIVLVVEYLIRYGRRRLII